MKNIRSEIAAYREAVRHLWNSTFLPLDESLRFGICLELFEDIDALIFKALVCEPHEVDFKKQKTGEPILNFRVVPDNLLTEVSVMINRSIPASGYWDDPVRSISTSGLDLAFISFFDWDGYNQKDMNYYRVRIINCTEPELNGKDALIETINAQVFLLEVTQKI